jgi:hypothetical protein
LIFTNTNWIHSKIIKSMLQNRFSWHGNSSQFLQLKTQYKNLHLYLQSIAISFFQLHQAFLICISHCSKDQVYSFFWNLHKTNAGVSCLYSLLPSFYLNTHLLSWLFLDQMIQMLPLVYCDRNQRMQLLLEI